MVLAERAGGRLAFIYIQVCVCVFLLLPEYLALSVRWLPLICDIWSPW